MDVKCCNGDTMVAASNACGCDLDDDTDDSIFCGCDCGCDCTGVLIASDSVKEDKPEGDDWTALITDALLFLL